MLALLTFAHKYNINFLCFFKVLTIVAIFYMNAKKSNIKRNKQKGIFIYFKKQIVYTKIYLKLYILLLCILFNIVGILFF